MQKEFKDFEKRGVWKVMKMRDMPPGRKLIGCKCVGTSCHWNCHFLSQWTTLTALIVVSKSGIDFVDMHCYIAHIVSTVAAAANA